MPVERLMCFDKALLSEAEGLSIYAPEGTNGSNIKRSNQQSEIPYLS